MGVALEQYPHYYHLTRRYRWVQYSKEYKCKYKYRSTLYSVLPREAHPGTRVGAAGATQGFNTGVTLYNLASMRQRQGQGAAMAM